MRQRRACVVEYHDCSRHAIDAFVACATAVTIGLSLAASYGPDIPDFNDSNKLGEGQAKVERLTNLVNIFANPQLDFSQNRTDHDDILGDAYEYLMRHFATESGKSKGQFYTPAEVSRVLARVIGISPDNTRASTTAYDPTCGSGSLLLKGGRPGREAHHHLKGRRRTSPRRAWPT